MLEYVLNSFSTLQLRFILNNNLLFDKCCQHVPVMCVKTSNVWRRKPLMFIVMAIHLASMKVMKKIAVSI